MTVSSRTRPTCRHRVQAVLSGMGRHATSCWIVQQGFYGPAGGSWALTCVPASVASRIVPSWRPDRRPALELLIESPPGSPAFWCRAFGGVVSTFGTCHEIGTSPQELLSALLNDLFKGRSKRRVCVSMIVSANARRLPHVYVGYYVAGCRSMEYERRFESSEVLGAIKVGSRSRTELAN
jgi:hypothetical protein